jgi:ubiquitin carboxyl-terminal hydrolase 10
VKKSWASLLKGDDATSTGKNALPTSTVVGFSIPGGLVDNSPSNSYPFDQEARALTLLTTGPSGPGQVPKIRPRGLVNSGNMCFANAVLKSWSTALLSTGCLPSWLSICLDRCRLTKKPIDNRISLTTGTIEFLKEFNPLSEKERKRREEDGEDYSSTPLPRLACTTR